MTIQINSTPSERDVRRLAQRKGYLLRKDRRSRDRYWLIHIRHNFHVGVNGDTFSLTEAEEWLSERKGPTS